MMGCALKSFGRYAFFIVLSLFFLGGCANRQLGQRPDVQQFIVEVSNKNGFERHKLTELFNQAESDPTIIAKMNKPAEKKPWASYRKILLTPARVRDGVQFWRTHEQALKCAEKTYGVPAQIIVAIIGVETNYGNNKGNFRVLNALSTLSFDYPKRAKFFRSELEQYLLLAREQGYDPLTIYGSYAGAIGIPQFMPSSYRTYAVAFAGNRQIDLMNNPVDAIGSVANYLKRKGWETGKPIAKPTTKAEDVAFYEGDPNHEYWELQPNFAVIMRYNTSKLYAMAVYQLSEQLLAAKKRQVVKG